MLTDLVQLRTFVVVAEEQHLSRAAERLNMSQSAASGHVKAIEERLGTQLFVRTNRNMELTHAGQLIAAKARVLLQEEAIFASFGRQLKGHMEGSLVIGVSGEPSTRIGEMVAVLHERHPLIIPDILTRSSSATRYGLLNGELDLGVMLCRSLEPNFACHELTKVAFRVAGPAAWKSEIDAAGWAELARLPWLTQTSPNSAYNAMLAHLFGEKGLELNCTARTENAGVARAAAIAGAAMILIREELALQDEKDGRLAVSAIGRVEMPLCIAYQSARGEDPLIKAFLAAAYSAWPEALRPSNFEQRGPPNPKSD